MSFIRIVFLASLALAISTHAPAAPIQQKPEHEHQQPATKAPADMSAKCKDMMAQHDKMMADMKAADQRLDALVAKMNSATGQAKTDATAAVVTEIVAQRNTTRDAMMKMHEGMMTHMMEHMQAGTASMAACPMMKGMTGMK